MEYIKLILFVLVAAAFTNITITTPYEDTKKVCFVSAFVWWVCSAINLIEIFIY